MDIVRRIVSRDAKLRFDGEFHRIPYDGPDATGLGKTLRLTIHPQHDIPIYLAAIGPKNVALAAEIADGWLPFWYSPIRGAEVFQPVARRRLRRLRGSGQAGALRHRPVGSGAWSPTTSNRPGGGFVPRSPSMSGGWGPRGSNFYFDLVCRYGYEEAATTVQGLYLDGKREEAMAALPDALIDEVSLLGTKEQLRDKLEVWREAGVTTLAVWAQDATTLRTLAELAL